MKKFFEAFTLFSFAIIFIGGMNQISAQGKTTPPTSNSTAGSDYAEQKTYNAFGQPAVPLGTVSEEKNQVSSSSSNPDNRINVVNQENQNKVINTPISAEKENEALTAPTNKANGSLTVPVGHVPVDQNSPSNAANGKVNLPMDHSLTPAEIEQLKKDPNSVLYQK